MTRLLYPLAGLSFLLLLASCEKEKSFSEIPAIESRGYNTNIINVKDTGDWIWSYNFVDGDGNLGTQMTDTAVRVYVVNKVTNEIIRLPFPYIPPGARGGKKFVKGQGAVRLRKNTFFYPRPFPEDRMTDTFVFEMYIIDDARNQSNILTTDSIFVSKEP
jgi:hypothetical protein